jgi:predicted RecB family nuclease
MTVTNPSSPLINSRTALLCHEYIHKKFAPSCFDLSKRIENDPLPTALKNAGNRFELDVLKRLKSEGIRILQINEVLADSRKIEETKSALIMPEIDAIYGSLFISATRISKPDLLVFVGLDELGNRQWRPVDIKSHSAYKENKSNVVTVTELPDISPETGMQLAGTLIEKDAFQLAHYIRHLQELGHCDGTPWAGIIGTDSSKIVWADLNALTYGVGKSAVGILSKYDVDSASGIDIVKKSLEREVDNTLPKVTIPRRISGDFGCTACDLRKVCTEEMGMFDSGNGHVTLLSGVTAEKAAKYLNGIESIADLAKATNLSSKGMVAVKRAQVWQSKKPEKLDPSRPLIVPEFDIEIDIDLENSQEAIREAGFEDSIGRDGVYLYGYGIYERFKNSDWKFSSFGYFDNYEDTDQAEFKVLSSMWSFLQDQVRNAEAQGKTIGIFHYSPHEPKWWRYFVSRHAAKPGTPTLKSIEDFMTKYFFDLYPIAQEVVFPVTGYSIKVLAPLAGFNWRMNDAGGGNSIVYYQSATSREIPELERSAAINWLRTYNEDDVRATMAVREYLRLMAKNL